MVLRVVGALAKALDEGYRRNKVSVARYYLTLALFRIIALCGIKGIPLFEIIEAKRAFNRQRADHKVENRKAEGGKKC
jgi:membrane-bound ClpP family serine protease